MNFTPLLVVLLGVVTVCSCSHPIPLTQHLMEYHHDHLQTGRDDHFYPRDRIFNNGHHFDRTQMGRLPQDGIAAAAFLPRHHDNSLNLEIIPQYAQYLAHNGVKVVQILGTLGGGPALRLADRRKVIDAWVRVGRQLGLRIRVQVGGSTYPIVIDTARYAQEAGADSILTLPDLFYKADSVEGLIRYINDVSRAAPRLPVLYYHFPNRTGVWFPPAQIVRMAKAHVPNFAGIQFESSYLRQIPATLKEMDHDTQLVFAGDHLMLPTNMLGVTSFMSRAINIWPQIYAEGQEALRRSDIRRARELQIKINMGIEAMRAAGNYIAALKATMEIVTGLKMGPPGPLPMITHSARNKLEHNLKALGLVYNH